MSEIEMSELEILRREVLSQFPFSSIDMRQFADKIINDFLNKQSDDYIDLGYSLCSMMIDDAIVFLPVILLGELQLIVNKELDYCTICVVDLIHDNSEEIMCRLSSTQRSTLVKWLVVVNRNLIIKPPSSFAKRLDQALFLIRSFNKFHGKR